jgi:sec-independent protein translocase protein TatA
MVRSSLRSSCAHLPGSVRASTDVGTSPTSSAPASGTRAATASHASAGPTTSGEMRFMDRALGPVGEPRDTQVLGDPGEEAIAGGDGGVEGHVAQRDERNDVHDPDPGVHPRVGAQVEALDCGAAHAPRRLLTHECEDRAVVMCIRVDVEQRITGRRGDRGHDIGPQALRDVHDAFEHSKPLPAGNERAKGTVATVGSIGAPELLILLLVVLLIFGGTKLPKLARSMGQAQTEFKRGTREGHTSSDDDDTPTDKA